LFEQEGKPDFEQHHHVQLSIYWIKFMFAFPQIQLIYINLISHYFQQVVSTLPRNLNHPLPIAQPIKRQVGGPWPHPKEIRKTRKNIKKSECLIPGRDKRPMLRKVVQGLGNQHSLGKSIFL